MAVAVHPTSGTFAGSVSQTLEAKNLPQKKSGTDFIVRNDSFGISTNKQKCRLRKHLY